MKKFLVALCLVSVSALAEPGIKLADYYQIGDSSIVNDQLVLSTTTAGVRAGVFAQLDTPVDLQNKTLRIQVKSSDWNNTKEFGMLFATDVFANSISIDLKSFITNPTDHEWIEVVVPVANWTQENNPDLSNINYVMWRAADNGASRVSTQVKGFDIIPEGNRAMLSITIDDGEPTTIDAYKIMTRHGLRGGIYIDEKFLKAKDWITQSQIDNIAKTGWDISGHEILERIPSISKHGRYEKYSGEYLTNINSLSQTEMDTIIAGTADYLKQQKYQGSNIFAYPNGIRSNRMMTAVEKNFKYGLNIDSLDNPTNYLSPYSINRRSINKATTVKQMTEWINQAKEKNLWIVLNFHTFVDNGTSDINYQPKDFEELCNYIVASKIEVLPVSKAIKKIVTEAPANIKQYSFY